MAKSEEELKSLMMRVKEESEKAGLKLNIHGLWSNYFMTNRRGKSGNNDIFYFVGILNHCRW